jgi:hypothetical protein
MPVIPSANTNLPILMLAEHAADRIAGPDRGRGFAKPFAFPSHRDGVLHCEKARVVREGPGPVRRAGARLMDRGEPRTELARSSGSRDAVEQFIFPDLVVFGLEIGHRESTRRLVLGEDLRHETGNQCRGELLVPASRVVCSWLHPRSCPGSSTWGCGFSSWVQTSHCCCVDGRLSWKSRTRGNSQIEV